MPISPRARLKHLHDQATAVIELVAQYLAIYVVPLGIAVVSAVAILFWPAHDSGEDALALPVKVLIQNSGEPRLESMREELRRQVPVPRYDTKLSVLPIWFSFTPQVVPWHGRSIEFNSRHAVDIKCWNAQTLELIGSGTRGSDSGKIQRSKAGFMMRVTSVPNEVLCRGTFAGPARLAVLQWPKKSFDVSVADYHRRSGLIDGGLIVLALFILVTALVNREKIYLVLAGWLIMSLRVGDLSAGWDIQWLGQEIPEEWLLLSRSVCIVLYGIGLVTLYRSLLSNANLGWRYSVPLKVVQWLCLPMLAAAFVLPYGVFLPVLWTILVCAFTIMTFGLLKVMASAPNRATAWFAASFALTFAAALAEVVSAALGVKEVLHVLNNVTSALGSGMLAALAVAEKMRMETEKRIEAQGKLERAYAVMPVALITLDLNGVVLSANPAARTMLALSQISQGRTLWGQFLRQEQWYDLIESLRSRHEAEMHVTSPSGKQRFLVLATRAGSRVEAVLQDVTDKHAATEKLRFLADNDPLTGVNNRRGIEKRFREATESAARGKSFALAYVDLDRFRLINDMFGHSAGDEVLKHMCRRMELVLKGGQYIGRVGGDEFVLVMAGTGIDEARATCREVVDYLGNLPYVVDGKSFNVQASIGLIEVVPGTDMTDAVATADRACRKAKEQNSKGLVTWPQGSIALLEHDLEKKLVQKLSAPNGTDGLFIEMQPIMSLDAPYATLDMEVLLRIEGDEGLPISGGSLVSAAEKHGRADLIDRWVLTETLRWMEDNLDAMPNTRFVCINISGSSLLDEQFVADTVKLLEQHSRVARSLSIEIAERVVLRNKDSALAFIELVRNRGAKVVLDNFGAGATSFAYLSHLPIDGIKIDGRFIAEINKTSDNVVIVEAIVHLARRLGIKTIAQWVHDAAAIRTLSRIGVNYVQGYAVARPQAPERLRTALSSACFIAPVDKLQLAMIFQRPAEKEIAVVA